MTEYLSRFVAVEQQIRRLWQRTMNTHATGRVVRVDDDGSAQKVQVRLPMGELIDAAVNHQQFGLSSNMPVDGDVTLSFLDGNRSKAVIVSTGHQQHRPRGVVIGGTVLHNAGVESIVLDPSGTITINAGKKLIIKAPEGVRIEGPLEVTEEITAKADGDAIHVSTHKHKGVQVGSGNTDKPLVGS